MRIGDLGLIAALGFASACEPIGQGSCDFPGGCDGPDWTSVRSNHVVLRTVTDLDTNEVLCSGCDACESVAARVGQRLLIEDRLRYVREKDDDYDGIPGVSFGCTADPRSLELDPNVTVEFVADVPALECWRAPERRESFRILDAEVVPGEGHRFQIEVLGPGWVGLEPSGECDALEQSRPIIVVVIPCTASGACPAPFACADGGECGYPSCGPEPERACPAPLDCAFPTCRFEACGPNNACAAPEECVEGVCRRLCGADAPCTPPATCVEGGACVYDGCSASRPCLAGFECWQGTCIRCEACAERNTSVFGMCAQNECVEDCPETACPAPLVCDGAYCALAHCRPNGPWCPEGQACIGGYCAIEPE